MGKGQKILLAFAAVIVAAAVFAGGYKFGAATGVPMSDRDTVYVTKTVTEHRPVAKTTTFKGWSPVPNYIFTKDTLTVRDTIPVVVHDTLYVPITTAYYERLNGRLRLWVSGYQPRLDKFELDEQTKIVPYRKHWGFSVGVGPSVIYSPFHNNIDAGIGIFGGFTYTF